MQDADLPDFDDVAEAIRDGRPLRPAKAYRIRFAQDNLDFTDLAVTDPVPLGRQILAVAGLDPERGFSLFAILGSGDFEDVRLSKWQRSSARRSLSPAWVLLAGLRQTGKATPAYAPCAAAI